MKTLLLSICLLSLAAGSAQADSLYRWVDRDGKVHYGDRPAEDAVKAEQKKFAGPSSAAGDDDLPYSVRKAKQDFPVTLYVAQNCGALCAEARSLLGKRAVPFAEKNLVTQEDIDAFKKLGGGNKLPMLLVGKTQLSGFEAGQWNSELDIAGYPKTAPYGTKPATPAKPETTPANER